MSAKTLTIAAALGLAALAGCTTYATEGPPGGYWYYGIGGYDDGGGRGRYHSGGGRSEPGNEAGMYPARPGGVHGGGSSGGGAARGGEAGN